MSIAVGINENLKPSVLTAKGNAGKGNDAQSLQSHFLTMLVTQLKNQDPTNPMQNSQLTTQLAQINTLSGIEKLNNTLGSISQQISRSQSLQSSMLVGHGVMVSGSQILVDKKVATPFGVALTGVTDSTLFTIKDARENVVRTIVAGTLKAGVHTFTWDGNMQDGKPAPDGKYSFSVTAGKGNTAGTVQSLNYARVNGVSTVNNTLMLDLGAQGLISLNDIRKIC
ncbi:flagellar hook assembly protein FlgD [Pantoea allii]|uniref:Basal-body rod modification protein FlgD n=1 Tax=Pantoea allii TaxID=574096 RepID=A0ABS6VIK2_9GAMM|nr:flagellar hook assembly protein FlgD [Pantoea allii]MBW1215030.1 flagellar hook assembly protein FlgD [Pantoea allii]MBW1258603.1 flagellar hook assembly protein FlgD [Pantoea allii]MBW1267824.1 flagellar hook assembly protein FlgD [Pantoea allii]MBW1289695.1 flagellar hook assembly protein FlgD [Pantoea allii]